MTPPTRYVHRLHIPLVFPAGLAPGAGKDGGNQLMLSRDGRGRPVLRGTAIAGVLRHAWAQRHGYSASPLRHDDEVARWFGYALGDDDSEGGEHRNLPSPLRVADALLATGQTESEKREHNAVDRHTGAVRDGGLFSLEALPPETAALLVLSLHIDDESGAKEFCSELLGLINDGLTVGGHGARGVGLAQLSAPARWRRFDLGDLDDCTAWLDESWQWRGNDRPPELRGEVLSPATNTKALRVSLELTIPRGQDICVGSGMGDEYPIEPQQVTAADGRRYWRLPGSSLRGVFRAWFTRLAAREARTRPSAPPADSAQRFLNAGRRPATGDELGWLFHSKDERADNVRNLAGGELDLDEVTSCPVADLFGSLYNAGRIHISDAIADQPIPGAAAGQRPRQPQHRRHVAVDRITGGANEGFLFDHATLLPGPRFRVGIVIQGAQVQDAAWLTATLRALDLGLIRVGSSKSSGRLALAAPPIASGPDGIAEIIQALQPSEVCHG